MRFADGYDPLTLFLNFNNSGVTLRRLGMRMYALACNSNTKCTQGGRKAQGLRFGDEITGINGQPVTGLSAEDAMDRLQECMWTGVGLLYPLSVITGKAEYERVRGHVLPLWIP